MEIVATDYRLGRLRDRKKDPSQCRTAQLAAEIGSEEELATLLPSVQSFSPDPWFSKSATNRAFRSDSRPCSEDRFC